MNDNRLKAAVLISGTGSNLKVLIDAIAAAEMELNIVRVISNREDAAGLKHAKDADIPISIISHKSYPDRQSHDAVMAEVIDRDAVELVILAGYMRILSEEFTTNYADRMINLHPSLLPLHKGLDTYNRALQSNDEETGASIHFVTFGLDSGPVISQVKIPIKPADDAATLKARLAPMEHKLLAATVNLFCTGDLNCRQDMISYQGKFINSPLILQADGTFET
jgi:phosphoribosylglycinamide formyltransferase-1